MSRGPQSFKKRVLTRAIEAVESTGIDKPYIVRIDDTGNPVVIVGAGVDKPKVVDVTSWDDAIAALERP